MNRAMSDWARKDKSEKRQRTYTGTRTLGSGVRDQWLQSISLVYLLNFFGTLVKFLQRTNTTFAIKKLFKKKHLCYYCLHPGEPITKQ